MSPACFWVLIIKFLSLNFKPTLQCLAFCSLCQQVELERNWRTGRGMRAMLPAICFLFAFYIFPAHPNLTALPQPVPPTNLRTLACWYPLLRSLDPSHSSLLSELKDPASLSRAPSSEVWVPISWDPSTKFLSLNNSSISPFLSHL